jgi:putative phosphoribosyl transferase
MERAAPLFMPFSHRTQAGRELGQVLLTHHPDWLRSPDIILAALPRGGLPVAVEVGRVLDLPVRLICVRKLGAPDQPELALGAIASLGSHWWNESLIHELGYQKGALSSLLEREQVELKRREKQFAPSTDLSALRNKKVVLIDDGVATGATLRAALRTAEKAGATEVYVATPVASHGTLEQIQHEWNAARKGAPGIPPLKGFQVIETPDGFSSVGEWYEDFPQLSDEDVAQWIRHSSPSLRLKQKKGELLLNEPQGGRLLYHLQWPLNPRGLVAFAHGSLSNAKSPRNLFVANDLGQAGYATFLFDLLTEEEFAHRAHIFDIPFLTKRLILGAKQGSEILQEVLEAHTPLPLILYGASTGAAAALNAAATLKPSAIISRGGRPDLADAEILKEDLSPILLLVGGLDHSVLELNQEAHSKMNPKRFVELDLIPDATHLFEEPGAMEKVAEKSIAFLNEVLAKLSRPKAA